MIRISGIILVLVLLLAVVVPTDVDAADWYSTYAYAKVITITGSPDGVLANYPKKLTLHEGSGADNATDVYLEGHTLTTWDATHCPTDIRFTNSTSDTTMDYWVQSYTVDTVTVWVEFNSIAASPTTTDFRLYYGLAGAAAFSNGTNTFTFFDDFERGSNGDTIGGSWTETAAHVHISTEKSVDGTRSAKELAAGVAATFPLTAATNTYAIMTYFWYPAIGGTDYCFPMIHGNATKRLLYTIRTDLSVNWFDTAWRDTTYNITGDAWNLCEVRNVSFTAYTCDLYLNDVLIKDNAPMQTDASMNNLVCISQGPAYVDNYIVRKWTINEPTWTFGAEILMLPVVNTLATTDVSYSSATGQCQITDSGATATTIVGMEWDVDSGAPYAEDVHLHDTYGEATYPVPMAGLPDGTTIYCRAYATNSLGTAYGGEVTFDTLVGVPPPPDCPDDLLATKADDIVTLTWTIGAGSDDTLVVRNLTAYPVDETDGDVVYFGALATCDDVLDIEALDATTIYYRAWGSNGGGLSACYDEISIGGENMSNSIILIPLLGLFVGLTVWGDMKRNWLLIIAATFGWFLMAGWCIATSAAMWDAYWIVGIVSVMLALITCIWPLIYKPEDESQGHQEDISEEDQAWGGKRHSRRHGPWDGDR